MGSSLFGAELAAQLGLPYTFASHFTPQVLNQAARLYRETFEPNGPLAPDGAKPHFIAAVNVIVADDAAIAHKQRRMAEDEWLQGMFGRGECLFSADELEMLRESPQAQQVLKMMERTVAGTQTEVVAGLSALVEEVQADELILVNLAAEEEHKHRTLELLAPL